MGGKEEETEIFTKTRHGAQTLAPSRQAGEGCVHVSLDLFTYPRKAWCQAQRCHSQRCRGRSVWLCWLLSWPRVPSLLPSGWLGTCSLLQKSGFPLLLWYQYFNCSQTAPMSSPPPPLSYLQLQVSVMNHFLGTSCSIPLRGKSCVN